MYAKINGGTVEKFPYTFGDLRKDNPNVSFPKNITQGVMQKFGMVGVLEGPNLHLQPTRQYSAMLYPHVLSLVSTQKKMHLCLTWLVKTSSLDTG